MAHNATLFIPQIGDFPMLKPLSIAGLLLLSSSAFAADGIISFSSLNARYIDSDISDISGDGFGVDFNLALAQNFFATLDYSNRKYDDGDLDVEFVSAGLGTNWGFLENDSLQLYATVTWEQLELDAANGSLSNGGGDSDADASCGLLQRLLGLCNTATSKAISFDNAGENRLDGYGLTGGARFLVMDNLEIGAAYQHRDYDVDTESVLGAHVGYSFGDWQILARYQTFDKLDISEWSLGVGYVFGKPVDESSSIW